jgi:tRNA (Thr-GGU) A37 N-methylase
VSRSPTEQVAYRPIGTVAGPIREPLRSELIRSMESRLVLEDRFEPAVAALEVGQHLLVVYHLHRAPAWDARDTEELFTRRSALPAKPHRRDARARRRA